MGIAQYYWQSMHHRKKNSFFQLLFPKTILFQKQISGFVKLEDAMGFFD